MTARPPVCTWLTPPHALTRSRLYASGWWCELHSPRRQRGLPDLPPSPGWPSRRQPPPDTTAPAAHASGAPDEESHTP
ncbi:hypothetical protein [Streptomyces zinciresistens]|uniref:hypothetical protein n=1 Tax=Streptomyces zinciresistens TaxID=1073330 RepID=UPI0005B8D375|nr:hypothetical protein [Streptomyces zinciresistens]